MIVADFLKRSVLGLVLCVAVAACGLFGSPGASAPGLPADASSAQVTADEVVQDLTVAWNAAVPVCLGLEDAGTMKAGECANVLLPARQALLTAAASVDAWNAGQSGQFACAVVDAMFALTSFDAMLNDLGVSVPSQVQTALSAAQWLNGFCPNGSAGASDAASDAGAG